METRTLATSTTSRAVDYRDKMTVAAPCTVLYSHEIITTLTLCQQMKKYYFMDEGGTQVPCPRNTGEIWQSQWINSGL